MRFEKLQNSQRAIRPDEGAEARLLFIGHVQEIKFDGDLIRARSR